MKRKAEDQYCSALISEKRVNVNSGATGAATPLVIYCDGGCKNNQKKRTLAPPKAGYGVYFGSLDDERNCYGPVPGAQTNNRGELYAIKRALEIVRGVKSKIEIVTDSEYSINCITKWRRSWEAKGMKTSTGKPVQNYDLLQPIYQMVDARKKSGAGASMSVQFTHVKAQHDTHAMDVHSLGNAEADRLAGLAVNKERKEEYEECDAYLLMEKERKGEYHDVEEYDIYLLMEEEERQRRDTQKK